MTPEVRLSPDRRIAQRLPEGFGVEEGQTRYYDWACTWFEDDAVRTVFLSAADVSDWTPLLPASSEDGAA